MTALAYDLGLRYLLLAAASLLAFGASLTHGFHFDDAALWVDPAITGYGWSWLQTRPLTWLTFRWNYMAAGNAPLGYHAVSLLLHVAVVLLLFHILREVLGQRAAFIAALVFAIPRAPTLPGMSRFSAFPFHPCRPPFPHSCFNPGEKSG